MCFALGPATLDYTTAMVFRSRGKVFAAAGMLGVVLLVKISGKGPSLSWATAEDGHPSTGDGTSHANRPRMVPVTETQPAPACPKLPPPVAAAAPKWQGSGKVAVHCEIRYRFTA